MSFPPPRFLSPPLRLILSLIPAILCAVLAAFALAARGTRSGYRDSNGDLARCFVRGNPNICSEGKMIGRVRQHTFVRMMSSFGIPSLSSTSSSPFSKTTAPKPVWLSFVSVPSVSPQEESQTLFASSLMASGEEASDRTTLDDNSEERDGQRAFYGSVCRLEGVSTLVELVRRSRDIVFVTGAGCSTQSGIPDYRGVGGSYSKGHKPMDHDSFMESPQERRRYWARSMRGWGPFYRAKPNKAHHAIAKIEEAGRVHTVITQNVDGLHQRAGSKSVIELHGTNHVIRCMHCGHKSDRNTHQRLISAWNFWWLKRNNASFVPEWNLPNQGESMLRADGDAELGENLDYSEIRVPSCGRCGEGILKPDVVYFGDSVPKERVRKAADAIDIADLLIVAGSSLSVLSSFRLVLQANERNIPIAVVNIGPTRAEREGIPLLKIEAEVGDTLETIVQTLQ